ncbi:hypothetical protein [Cohnella thailandensis]|uniref:Uncharacterized protein n=1 Tax=Cohnella thailandensis TaxID=557557 RepID=A0A841T8X3_9BACL|nr:hypothetical protein [Cohnella thailandensis]MBB6637641.1 hypothetical protein [Cohnella thailandensis]MBP1974183.1 hypothetical protein [Cohnella thailandensis]
MITRPFNVLLTFKSGKMRVVTIVDCDGFVDLQNRCYKNNFMLYPALGFSFKVSEVASMEPTSEMTEDLQGQLELYDWLESGERSDA